LTTRQQRYPATNYLRKSHLP